MCAHLRALSAIASTRGMAAGIEAGRLVDVLDVVWRNRRDYADRHGYTLLDLTAHVGTARPKSWYKLKAVESVLNHYDWVFWLDADAWITNPEIPLESVLPASKAADFLVTEDATGANAGSWLLRNSDWSRAFLREWWSMESFIRVRRTGLRFLDMEHTCFYYAVQIAAAVHPNASAGEQDDAAFG